MALILAIETATKVCSVALFDGSTLLACVEEGGAYSHAEKLTPFIEKVCHQSKVDLLKIDAVAISKGPGSYTGLRIGVSSAKGICYALNKPLIAIETLRAMAVGAREILEKKGDWNDHLLRCPMIDARRMEVYASIYDHQLREVKPTAADIIDENFHYQEFLSAHPVVYFGDGAGKCKPVFEHEKNAVFLESSNVLPSARFMGELAQEKFARKVFEDVAYFEPFYLKDFIATQPKKPWSGAQG